MPDFSHKYKIDAVFFSIAGRVTSIATDFNKLLLSRLNLAEERLPVGRGFVPTFAA